MGRLEEGKKQIKELYTFEFTKQSDIGGQHCGMYIPYCIVKSEELDIEIKVRSFRSNHKNRELATVLMDLAMDEIIK